MTVIPAHRITHTLPTRFDKMDYEYNRDETQRFMSLVGRITNTYDVQSMKPSDDGIEFRLESLYQKDGKFRFDRWMTVSYAGNLDIRCDYVSIDGYFIQSKRTHVCIDFVDELLFYQHYIGTADCYNIVADWYGFKTESELRASQSKDDNMIELSSDDTNPLTETENKEVM